MSNLIEVNDNKAIPFHYVADCGILDGLRVSCQRLEDCVAKQLGFTGECGTFLVSYMVCNGTTYLSREYIYIDRFADNGMTMAYSNSYRALYMFLGAPKWGIIPSKKFRECLIDAINFHIDYFAGLNEIDDNPEYLVED